MSADSIHNGNHRSSRLSGKKRRLVLLSILVLQMTVILFWAHQRQNYYVDELYSFGYAQSYLIPTKDFKKIDLSEEWKFEEWIRNQPLKEQLEVTKEESLLCKGPAEILKLLVTRRNYHGLLNIVMSLFSPGEVSMAPGIVMNLVFFMLAQLLLFRIMSEMTGSFSLSAVAVLMYGFSGMAISMAYYIRFYMLVILLVLAATRVHQIIWRTENLLRVELFTFLGTALFYFALKDSELVLIIWGSMAAAFVVGMLLKRQWKKAALYFVTVFLFVFGYVAKKTSLIDILLHPSSYASRGGAAGWTTRNLMAANPERMIQSSVTYFEWLGDLLFGSQAIMLCFFLLLLILAGRRFLYSGKHPAAAGKYQKDGRSAGFVWIIAAVCAVYLVFSLLTALFAERYLSLLFPFFTILFWKAVHELTRSLLHRRRVLTGMLLMVCTGILSFNLFHSDRLLYLYHEDVPLIQAVQNAGIQDVILVSAGRHSLYECVNLLPDEAMLYPMDLERHEINAGQCPEEMLIWINTATPPDPYVTDLVEDSYEIRKLGSTHTSDVYLARKPF